MVVPVILSMQEILNNRGENQEIAVFNAYIKAAEKAIEDAFDAALFGDGSGGGGKAITGLGAAIPIVTNANTYGGIDRSVAANAIWKTTTYDAQSHGDGDRHAGQLDHDPAVPQRHHDAPSRGRDHADLLIMSPEHYAAYDAATVAIQRQTNSAPRSANSASARWNTSAAENAPRSCSMAASAATCRPIRRSASTPTA